MRLTVTEELHQIFREIVEENRSEVDWALVESDDMFQTDHFAGGFDVTEMAFCFSYFAEDKNEYWFQLTVGQIAELNREESGDIVIRPAG